MPDLSKFRECIEILSLIRVSPADGEIIYRPLEKKAHETQTKPHFLMVYRPQETVPK